MITPTDIRQSRDQKIATNNKSLKKMKLMYKIPIIALAQLKREADVKAAQGKRPTISDLGESSALEKDADIVTMLYSEDYAEDNEEVSVSEIEMVIRKNRRGRTGTAHVNFQKEFQYFG